MNGNDLRLKAPVDDPATLVRARIEGRIVPRQAEIAPAACRVGVEQGHHTLPVRMVAPGMDEEDVPGLCVNHAVPPSEGQCFPPLPLEATLMIRRDPKKCNTRLAKIA